MEKQTHPLRILVVDDEEAIRYAMRAIFDHQGWQMIPAGDVEEAMEKFRQMRPDLVIMDYHLPKINGVKGVEMMRREDPDVPLIVFTIDDSQEVADRFLDAGASDFILKPLRALDIVARIKLHIRLLESQRSTRQVQSSEPQVKGIGQSTLQLIESCLEQAEDTVTVEMVAESTGLAYQTTYRYLQHMVATGQAEVSQVYGKVGRPKQHYRLVKKG